MQSKRFLIYPSVAVASLTTLLFELTQTRILSCIFWNHIVYLTVALALLGFGISGTLVAVRVARHGAITPRFLSRLWIGFGLTMFGAVALTAWVLPLLHALPPLAKLGFCYTVYVVPFVFAGAILSATFAAATQGIGRLYAVDLACAGGACLLFFWLLPGLGAVPLVCVLALLAVGVGYFWSEAGDRDATSLAGGGSALLGLCLTLHLVVPGFLEFLSEDYKEMGSILSHGHPDTHVEATTWTSLTRIDVIGNDKACLLGYREHPVGSYKIITQDGSAHTRLLSRAALDKMRREVAEHNDPQLFNAVYLLKHQPDTAVIGVGGGMDVAYALAYDSRSVLGIEINPAIYKYASRDYDEYTGGLLSDPRLTLVNQEGRSALRSLDRKFDVIQINAIDTFAALSSGAYVLSESHLYTVEAMQDLFAHLKDDGILSVHRWLFNPPRETLRLSVLACEAWKREGVTDPQRRIMVFGKEDWAVTLFKNQPFTPAEVALVKARMDKLGAHVLFWPQVLPPAEQARTESSYYAKAPAGVVSTSRIFGECIGAYRDGTEQAFLRSYTYNVTPTTDDSPFFFEYHYLNAFGLPAGDEFRETLRGGNNVALTIYLILGQSTVFILLAVFWPLWRYQRQGVRCEGAGWWSAFFAAVGLGFMLVEIGVIQKSVLFLGNPMYALTVVLASLLVSAGLGSSLLGVAGWDARQVTRYGGPAFLLFLLGLCAGLNPLYDALLHLPLAAKVAVVVAVNLPLGALMGLFFPCGLQTVRKRAPLFVPWAWGINGCASVYGSILAILIAMVYGFNAVLLAGAAVYALGLLAAQLGLPRAATATGLRVRNIASEETRLAEVEAVTAA